LYKASGSLSIFLAIPAPGSTVSFSFGQRHT
jgi:hypothetical protein